MNRFNSLILLMLILSCLISAQASESTFINFDPSQSKLKTFTSDGCTGVPTNLLNFNNFDDFAHCCLVHDVVYWIGGSTVDKEYADEELIACFNDSNAITNLTNTATAMALDIIGWDHWGTGWQTPRYPNHEFTKQEISEVVTKLTELKAKKYDFKLQFRMNERQYDYIEFWLETFIKGFSSI